MAEPLTAPAAPPTDRLPTAGPDPASRGSLTVEGRAIERIAAIAAAQVHGVVRAGSRWDRTTGRELPHVTARTAGGRARLVVETAVAWPAALGEVATGVRDAVTDRLRELAAVEADGVDVVVVKIVLPPAVAAAGRVS